MSHLYDLDSHSNDEKDDIDAFNDETFGCDLADINDDWEEEHDKLLPTFDSSQDGDGKKNDSNAQQKANIQSFLNYSKISSKTVSHSSDVFPQCEDIVKQSISDLILDEDLYNPREVVYPDFTSYELEMQNEPTNMSRTKIDAKSINLESLKPPSPSILPFDDPFMSSVWRPLSPELNTQNSPQNLSRSSANESITTKIITLEELEKNLSINGHNDSITIKNKVTKTKVIRLEDLEAQLLEEEKPKNESSNNSMSNSSFGLVNEQQMQAFMQGQGKMPQSIMEMAAMSLSKLSLQSPNIPPTNKVLPPPPGLGSKFNSPGMSSVDPRTSMQNNQGYMSKMSPSPKPTDVYQSQMAMATAMANALANMSQLPMMRPPMPQLSLINPDLKLTPSSSPMVMDPLVQQEQQRIINRIITPAQAQRFYHPSHLNNFLNPRNRDKFAGFMTQKEKDWLVKIFRLQSKVNDPYVEDYYEVNYRMKKATEERRKILAKQHNKDVDDPEIDAMFESDNLIVLPEMARPEEEKPKYIQFDNALGKIQVLNTRCPRKLLDINPEKHSALKLDTFSRNLLKIERLYEILLKIEDEDRRLPILPESFIQSHRDKRALLCQNLFKGLTIPINNSDKDEGTYFTLIKRNVSTLKKIDTEIDPELLKINKGLILVYRSLLQLRDVNQLVVLICSLLRGSNYQKFIREEDLSANYGKMLIKALGRIEQARDLIYIISALEDFELFSHKYGHLFLVTIFKQYQASNDKLLYIYFWKLFVKVLVEQLSSCPELRQLCIDHYEYLEQL